MGKTVKKIVGSVAKFAGPIAALSGVGLPLSAAIGAGGGLLSGGGLKGALAGGLSGATLSGGGSLLGSGLGLSGGLGNAVGSGLLGAASGGLTGGVKGALLGGLGGAAGGYLSTPGSTENLLGGDTFGHVSGSALGGQDGTGILGNLGIGSISNGAAPSSYSSSIGGSYGDVLSNDKNLFDRIGTGISDAYHGATSSLGLSNPTDDYTRLAGQDSAQDALIGPTSNLSGASKVASNNSLSPILSGLLGTYSNDASEKALLKQQQANQGLLSPFLSASFNPGDLTADPGYQFQLQQGQQALDRKQAASGNYFSGGALQAAQDYGQGLASTTYGDAFTRFLQSQQQKLGAAGALAGVNDNIGNIKAGAITNQNNLLSGVGAGLLGGSGYSNSGNILNSGNGDYLSQLLRQMASQGKSSYGV